MDSDFNRVFSLVERGRTIQHACEELGINRNTFYLRMSKEQKIDLKRQKALNAKVAIPTWKGKHLTSLGIEPTFPEDDED